MKGNKYKRSSGHLDMNLVNKFI